MFGVVVSLATRRDADQENRFGQGVRGYIMVELTQL